MRPPKDPENFASHVIRSDGAIRVYCVECERWAEVVVIAEAIVTYRQNQRTNKTEDALKPGYHCGTRNCRADVGYLLSDDRKGIILILADVPAPQPARPKAPLADVDRLEKQLRLI